MSTQEKFDFELEESEQYGRRTGVNIEEDGKAVVIRQQNAASIGATGIGSKSGLTASLT